MDLRINYSIPTAKAMNCSRPQFKGKQQMADALVKKGRRKRIDSDLLRLWGATTAYLSFILFLAGEFCSIGYTGKSLGQNLVEETRQKIEDYRFEHGDNSTKVEILQ